jgi:hypothetical protein
MMNQEPRRLNATEIVLPQEVQHESAAHLPALMPSAPLDWPMERFTQALDRREVNRKALLKWIQSNLQAGIDFGQIHFVGKDKCRLARLTVAPTSASTLGIGASRPCGSPARRKSVA